jgi:hypothetical protein
MRNSFQVVSSKAIGDSFSGSSGVFVLFPENKIASHCLKVRHLCKHVVLYLCPTQRADFVHF